VSTVLFDYVPISNVTVFVHDIVGQGNNVVYLLKLLLIKFTELGTIFLGVLMNSLGISLLPFNQ
jgi:hypothetical protein